MPRIILKHYGWCKRNAILHTTNSNAFAGMKIFEFQFKFNWNFFLSIQLTIFNHWFRLWHGQCSKWRTGNFFETFLQFYVHDLRFKAAGLTTFFWLSFEHWHGADQATSHYLYQWSHYRCISASLSLNELKKTVFLCNAFIWIYGRWLQFNLKKNNIPG